ncbi:MAG: Ku protein [Deltaproteobacteria bacterium]|nr:MAG: Ku protein [Deltaproteobacteria bacterium]
MVNERAIHGIWSGTISFSLVAIPVQLVKAVEPGRVSFRLLHDKDYSPLARRMFCPREEAMVPPEEIIRGYEIGPGKYLTVTDEELESVSPERSRTIEIIDFIDLAEVDSVYFDHPYYLIPAKGGEKAYTLLAEVLFRTHKAGLAKFVLHEREYPVLLKSTEGALALITLHYHEEILGAEDISPPEAEADAAEKSLIKTSIQKMLADFDPRKYADARRQRIIDLLKKKAKEQGEVEAPAAAEEAGEGPADLIAALEESMRRVKQQ